MNEKGNINGIYAYAKTMLKVMDDYADNKAALLEGIAILTTAAYDKIEGRPITPVLLTAVIQYMAGIKDIDNLRGGCQMIVDEIEKEAKNAKHVFGMAKYMADMLFEQGIHIDASDLNNE
jgi:cell division septum initiation protein DivIVA